MNCRLSKILDFHLDSRASNILQFVKRFFFVQDVRVIVCHVALSC